MKSHFNFAVKAIKKKGFTLIELLAVIVILAVIALILTPQILSVINEAKEGSLEATKKSIVKASELYVVSNIEDFTLEVGEKAYIQLSELEDGYIKSIKNTSGESCAGYVKVEKTEEDYDYTVYLDCGNGENLLVDSSYVNYGGDYLDEFYDVIETSDGGYIAVGYSNSTTFSDNARYGDTLNYDAIIVKYDSNGLEEWSHNFGGTGNDCFYSVIDDGSGYVVVGSSTSQDGDLNNFETNSYNSILVKYSYNGNMELAKVLSSSVSSSSNAYTILYDGINYYVSGGARYIDGTFYYKEYIVKYNANFNEIWTQTYAGGYQSHGYKAMFNNDNNIVLVGDSASTDSDIGDIKIGVQGNLDATIFIINSDTGEIINKGIFGGDGTDYFYDVLEVADGYIVTGSSSSNNYDMQDINKGNVDAVVVKYSKTAEADENGVLPIVWKKVIGGSSNDYFRKIFVQDNYIIAAGYSNSTDGDLQGISKSLLPDYDGLIVKMDSSGNILSTITYGGSQSDYIYGGMYSSDKFILVGTSFSLDNDVESFNLGNSDAIMFMMDNNLEAVNTFQLETLLMSQAKELIVNYGTSIPSYENRNNLKLFTTNDSTADLGKWCTSDTLVDEERNYNGVSCLKPFDTVNIRTMINQKVDLTNDVSINPIDSTNWLKIMISFHNYGSPIQISNLMLAINGETMTIADAVDGGLIEPLVLIDSSHYNKYYFQNSFSLLSGETVNSDRYGIINILIKQKGNKVEGISFNSNVSSSSSGTSLVIAEFLNFDISLTPNTN
ncbi:MAG: type II secretion system protein [Bacilli bacterium]|nr:type II secretion system protein [Bacilli bacterium]